MPAIERAYRADHGGFLPSPSDRWLYRFETVKGLTSLSRGADSRPSLANGSPSISGSQRLRQEGRGECRVRAAPAVSCAQLCEETHTSIQVQRKHSGIPRAMALRLMPCSPRRRIRLVTVISGSMAYPTRLGRIASADLAPATGARTTTGFAVRDPCFARRFRRAQVPIRRNPGEGGTAPFVLRAGRSLTANRPAIKLARRRCRVHHIPSRVRDDRDPPLLGDETARTGELICPTKPAKCFCEKVWTTQITLKSPCKLKFTRSGFFCSFEQRRMRTDFASFANSPPCGHQTPSLPCIPVFGGSELRPELMTLK